MTSTPAPASPGPGELPAYLNLIDGHLQSADVERTLPAVDPATGAVWATIPASGTADVEAAAAAAHRAFPAWAALSAVRRARYLRDAARVLNEHAGELAEIESRDTGRPLWETTRTYPPGKAVLWERAADAAAEAVSGRSVVLDHGKAGFTRREPYGVLLGIIPWNTPFTTFSTKAAWALAAGNTVIIKPAEDAAAVTLRAGELLHDVLPPGTLNIVSGSGAEAGDLLVRDHRVARISLTGSTVTGRSVAAAAAGRVIPVTLELGGKSPNIVFSDANLDQAIPGLTTDSVFTGNAGQLCLAGSRILVQEPVLGEVVERIRVVAARIRLGSQWAADTTMGPLVSARHYERVVSYLKIAEQEGARLIFGGGHGSALFPVDSPLASGYWVEPTLYQAASNSLRICQEEIFGPVAVVIPFGSEEEAVEIANDSQYGLAAGVWTGSSARAQRMVRDLHVGTVWINTFKQQPPELPFQGTKSSGYGEDSILSNTWEKSCIINLT